MRALRHSEVTMADQRLSGQDTEITVMIDGEPLTITAIKSHEFTYRFKNTEEEYCGETSPRFDEFFNGVSGRLELDNENTDVLTLMEVIRARAQNRAVTTRIGVKTVLQYPNGDRALVNVTDAKFGDIPVATGSRSDYVRTTLSYQADKARIVSR